MNSSDVRYCSQELAFTCGSKECRAKHEDRIFEIDSEQFVLESSSRPEDSGCNKREHEKMACDLEPDAVDIFGAPALYLQVLFNSEVSGLDFPPHLVELGEICAGIFCDLDQVRDQHEGLGS